MISNQNTSKNHVICLELSVNAKPCGIKHCARCIKQGASDTKLPRLGKFRSIISLSKITLDVVCPHIQLKKQGNKKSNITDGEGEGGGVAKNLEKVSNIVEFLTKKVS